MNPNNPVLSLMQRADQLAQTFVDTHKQTIPVVQQLVHILTSPSSAYGDPDEYAERQLAQLRVALERMEGSVSDMMSMLYHVDVFLAAPTLQGVSGKDPKAALEHVSDSFHVSKTVGPITLVVCNLIDARLQPLQMYQSELLEKREALADLTCEEISADEFASRWSKMDQVQAGRQQTMDDLADLLAGLG